MFATSARTGIVVRMRTRTLPTSTTIALRARVAHEGLIRASVGLSVSPTTLARALRGAALALTVCERLERGAS
jgi:hypothetical protein